MMSLPDTLRARVRPPRAPEPAGAIVLLHGRGADENDLFPLFDLLDPNGAWLGITLRGPLSLPPGGSHWYVMEGIPTPQRATFDPTFERLAGWFDDFFEHQVPAGATIIGGFSQGCVMAYALTLARSRPVPAGLLAFSGFLPEVEGLDLAPQDRPGLRVGIAHGTLDPVIPVEWSRRARDVLQGAGAEVLYRESPLGHTIDPAFACEAAAFVLG